MATTSAACGLPRTMTFSSRAGRRRGPAGRSPWRWRGPGVGEKPPEVTTPTTSPSASAISAPSRAGAPSSTCRPTRTRRGPSASSLSDARGAGEVARFAAALGDGEGEVGLDRAEPSRRGRGRRAAGRPPGAGSRGRPGRSASPARRPAAVFQTRSAVGGRDRDLVAVLAGVAGARDDSVGAEAVISAARP